MKAGLISRITFLMICSSCTLSDATADAPGRMTVLRPTSDFQYQLQSALIDAVPGDIIELVSGTYRLTSELNIACDNLTIRGHGPTKTILNFKGQDAGSNGIVSTGNAFVIENLAVEDTVGNAIKTLGSNGVTFRNVRVEWTGGPKSTNGAYGIYPVECRNVLIENCTSIAASDAGIYVGQSQDVIVRGCRAERNVAGIEIENTLRADVYNNIATNNTGGILVFDLPGLTVTNGGQVRVFKNTIEDNNHTNFAPKGTMVSEVPQGTGLMLMATDSVEVFDNDISDHQTSNIMVVSFLITQRKINDPQYDPFPEATSIHNNRISKGGYKPAGQIGTLLTPVLAGNFPDIFFDGIVDSDKLSNGQLPNRLQLSILDNPGATFANVHIDDLNPTNLLSGKYSVDRDLKNYAQPRKPLNPITLQSHPKPTGQVSPTVAAYRTAPQKLSGWKFYVNRNQKWETAPDLLPYELNTPLFSDYTLKHRFIRLPSGSTIDWKETDVLDFPVGTVIGKTFAYPDNTIDQTPNERFLETRIEFRDESGWIGYSYMWNESQSDAELQLGGGVIDVTWTDKQGRVIETKYQIPNANQCLSCHSQNSKFVPIGPTARNLNRPAIDHGHNQLQHWIETKTLEGAPPIGERSRLTAYDDESASVNSRARAWLEVNCAHCHNPAGSARTSGLDLRAHQTDPGKFGVLKSPVAAGKGTGGRRYDIVPGKPEESILMFRLETEEPGARMPNLARSLTHRESNELIHQWISKMPETTSEK